MLRRFLESFIPPALKRQPDVAWRARFLLQASVLGSAISSVSAVVYYVGGWWPGTLTLLLLAALLPLMLVALRWTGSVRFSANLGLGIALLAFTVPTLVERTLDGALLALFALFPFLAVLLLDERAAWLWTALAALALGGIFVSHEWGLVPTVESDSPRFVTISRVAMLFATLLFFSLRFAAERAHTMDALAQGSRAKSAFLANMSHEIRTPMNGLLGLTEVMLAEPQTPEQREKLELMRRSGRQLVSLLNDVLDLSKVEAGRLTLVPEDFDVHAVVRDVALLFQPVAAQRGLAFAVAGLEGPLSVRGDAARLRQVLTNLLSNALKFTEHGQVRLDVEALPPQGAAQVRLRFSVTDTGVGIPAEVQQRLFTPFEQGDPSTARRFGGTGLGLALSRHLVELMGGALAVDSAPGRGSRFTFELAFAPGTLPASGPSRPPSPVPEATPRDPVLVVDDNPINLKVACALVERAGFRTATASDGTAALALLERQPFSLVLMDVHMPGMDGLEATRRLRALPGDAARTPVVALTASAMPEDLEACRGAGMDDVVAKPIERAALQRALALARGAA